MGLILFCILPKMACFQPPRSMYSNRADNLIEKRDDVNLCCRVMNPCGTVPHVDGLCTGPVFLCLYILTAVVITLMQAYGHMFLPQADSYTKLWIRELVKLSPMLVWWIASGTYATCFWEPVPDRPAD